MLEFLQLKKTYGSRTILSIPFAVLDNGIYWLQGSNGTGKTTLLRMIAGLLPFKGDIRIDGHSLQQDPIAYRKAVSWADAEPTYPDFLTGEDIVSFYQAVRKTPSEQAERLLTAFSMESYIATRIGSWSDGMVKKLSLIAAFLGNPSFILLDEPLVTLDSASVPLLYQMILEHHSRGCGFLFTSHQDIDPTALPLEKKLLIQDQTIV